MLCGKGDRQGEESVEAREGGVDEVRKEARRLSGNRAGILMASWTRKLWISVYGGWFQSSVVEGLAKQSTCGVCG